MILLKDIIKKRILFLISIIALFIIIVISMFLGTVSISFFEIVKAIFYKFIFNNNFYFEKLKETDNLKIILELRMPRIISAVLIGGALATIGSVFQGLFKNSMADPFIIGVSSGGALGATIGIILSTKLIFDIIFIPIFAFLGAVVSLLLIITIMKFINNNDISILLLIGISINFFSSALMSVLMFMNHQNISQIIIWNMGTLSNSSWNQLYLIFIITFLVIFCFYLFRRELNVLALGEDEAKGVGISVYFVKMFLIILSSLLIGVIVSFSGTIGFVGLIIPHITRLIIGANYKLLIPFSMIFGAGFLVICDTISRLLLAPGELPIGAITAMCGTPFFIFLLIYNKKKRGNNIYD